MSCVSRITDEAHAQKFGNGRNKFYIEFRCGNSVLPNHDVCARCIEKSVTATQTSRKFQHGKVYEPIPDESHLFGGTWYQTHLSKYGSPTEDVLRLAFDHQQRARTGFPPVPDAPIPEPPTKSTKPIKRISPKQPKESKKEKKEPMNPYSSFIQQSNPLVYKEVTIPTHLEKNIEQFDADGYEIVHVRLIPFEHQGTSYFRDHSKQKLYRNIKQKIGEYVGRYDVEREEIRTDIPDSDDDE